MSGTETHVNDLLARYRTAAVFTSDQTPTSANKWARRLHHYYKELREAEEGQAGITALIDDPDPHVRCWAAAHSLAWAPEAARRALEALRDGGGPCALDAKWALREYAAGKLSFEH